MCTLSIVPRDAGFRLMCNRDEQVTRPASQAPRRVSVGRMTAVFPIDPRSGGTWVGVNAAGVAAALLNRTPALDRRRSRGDIVPRLLGAADLPAAARLLDTVDPYTYDAFRVVVAHGRDLLVATSDGVRMQVLAQPIVAPIVFTSSSLGDALAECARLPLFSTMVAPARDRLAAQLAYHEHQWRDCLAFSVRMRRPDARTVSRTVIDVDVTESLTYEALPER